jgi:hypothetical protein
MSDAEEETMMKTQDLLMTVAVVIATSPWAVPNANAAGSGFAVVNAGGDLVRGTALSALRTGAGAYVVTFDHNVKNCVFTATTGSASGGTPLNAYATVAGFGTDPNGVVVTTFDHAGAAADFAFHLNVRC